MTKIKTYITNLLREGIAMSAEEIFETLSGAGIKDINLEKVRSSCIALIAAKKSSIRKISGNPDKFVLSEKTTTSEEPTEAYSKRPMEFIEEDIVEQEANNEDNSISDNDLDSPAPFEPKDINIVVEQKTIDNLVQRIRYEEIDMNTEFQRKGNLWDPQVQSRLIESILLRFPLPAFFFDAAQDEKWLVVDGLQRLWTFKKFIVDKELKLQGLEILKRLNTLGFDELDRSMQRRLQEAQVTTYLIQPGTPKRVKYNVFHRINTGGLVLNSMEIRNALNQGIASDFLKSLTEAENFKKYIRIRDQRMEDRELILRALAFALKDCDAYKSPLSGFLDDIMELLGQQTPSRLKALETDFFNALQLSDKLFGKHLFSRSICGGKSRFRLNSALFEVFVSRFMRMDEAAKEKLLSFKKEFVAEFKQVLKKDTQFSSTIISSTSGKKALNTRFSKISELIEKYIA